MEHTRSHGSDIGQVGRSQSGASFKDIDLIESVNIRLLGTYDRIVERLVFLR